MKICKKCGLEKDISDFYKSKTNLDGHEGCCKKCKNKYRKKTSWHQKMKNNKDYNQKRKEYYIKNRDIICEKTKKYRDNNIELARKKESMKRKTEKYREHRRNYMKEYNKKNNYILAWRSILHNTLKRFNTKKTDKTIKMLGYSATELKTHMENLFTSGMSWDNHGEWHIDHIKPVSSFSKDTDIKVVNSLDNLQPLWATTREIDGLIYEGNLNKNAS